MLHGNSSRSLLAERVGGHHLAIDAVPLQTLRDNVNNVLAAMRGRENRQDSSRLFKVLRK